MEIYLYTEPGCGACVEAKTFLTSREISFEERDVHGNPEYLRILTDDLDSCTLPTLVAGDTIIAGFDREAYESLRVKSPPKRVADPGIAISKNRSVAIQAGKRMLKRGKLL
jgi:glutaredoxin